MHLGQIRFKYNSEASWTTNPYSYILPKIDGTDLYTYESTVENIASSIIVHEWFSHGMKKYSDDKKNHRFAYMNVIDYYKLWKNTTTKYKIFVLKKLIKYTIKETNQKYVDKKYWPIYKKFNIEYKIR